LTSVQTTLPPSKAPTIAGSISNWWRGEKSRSVTLITCGKFLRIIGEFLRNSTRSRRRQRFGDADFDWDRRVNTTGGTVSARDRFLGMFHSPYQPTEPALFAEMMDAVASLVGNNGFRDVTFIDIGSGKGRALLLAADYPFRRIVGVELLPELDRIAKDNIANYKSECQKCFAIESIVGDAGEFHFPQEPLVVYLFNPLPEAGLAKLISNLEGSLRAYPRPIFILYHNPLLEGVLAGCSNLRRVDGTHQYAIYSNETIN
jgi:SAM-dependent methyltransferase